MTNKINSRERNGLTMAEYLSSITKMLGQVQAILTLKALDVHHQDEALYDLENIEALVLRVLDDVEEWTQ